MERIIKVCVFGSRGYTDYKSIKENLDNLLGPIMDKASVVIISGTASGADSLGERYALENGLGVERYPAKWDDLSAIPCNVKTNSSGKEYNSLAGMNRNRVMADVCDIAVGFIVGNSPGSTAMVKILNNKKKQVRVIRK